MIGNELIQQRSTGGDRVIYFIWLMLQALEATVGWANPGKTHQPPPNMALISMRD